MSLVHLTAFIADVKSINPDFKESTSSLKGLLKYLQETAIGSPQPFANIEAALRKCSRFRDKSLLKYRPAIGRLVEVWGQGAVAYPLADRLQKSEINRICFRGDARNPEVIFANGFSKQEVASIPTYRNFTVKDQGMGVATDPYRAPIAGLPRGGDIDPTTAVCVTPDLLVAALFPLPGKWDLVEIPTWVYMVFLETGYNTNARQVLDALAGLSALSKFQRTEPDGPIAKTQLRSVRVNDILQNLYGRELAADGIPASRVIAAIKIQRQWTVDQIVVHPITRQQSRSVDYKQAGTFQILAIEVNRAAQIPLAFQVTVDEFIRGVQADVGKQLRMPTHTDGFVQSQPKLLPSG